MVRFLLVEAAQVTVRSVPEWRRKYVHLTMIWYGMLADFRRP